MMDFGKVDSSKWDAIVKAEFVEGWIEHCYKKCGSIPVTGGPGLPMSKTCS